MSPAKPTEAELVSSSKGKITISWGEANEDGLTFRVVRFEDGSGKGWVGMKRTTATSFTDTKVKSGKRYRYRVHAYKMVNGAAVFSAYSDPAVIDKAK